MPMLYDALYGAYIVAATLAVVSIAYLLAAIWRLGEFAGRAEPATTHAPPVTVLIPIRGVDAGLRENLRSICRQDYGEYQLILGVQDAADPAIEVARGVMREFPDRDVTLVIDDRAAGPNLKIGNLSNMYPRARHSVLVILDSDMRVGPDYLASVTAPFRDPRIGLVTCLYKGTPTGGLASTLGGMFIDEWFLPSVLVAHGLRGTRHCFGATMAVRRDAFAGIGGFARLRPYLADDYMLGQLIGRNGYRVHLSSYIVENVVAERDLKSLLLHELRWARTIRAVQPVGYAFSFVMFSIPLAILGALLSELSVGADVFAWGLVAVAVSLRIAMHFLARRVVGASHGPTPWLVPIRDLLSFAVWAVGLFGREVWWRGRAFSIHGDGLLVPKG